MHTVNRSFKDCSTVAWFENSTRSRYIRQPPMDRSILAPLFLLMVSLMDTSLSTRHSEDRKIVPPRARSRFSIESMVHTVVRRERGWGR